MVGQVCACAQQHQMGEYIADRLDVVAAHNPNQFHTSYYDDIFYHASHSHRVTAHSQLL